MSLWFFLSDWFGGTTTWGGLFKRVAINALWAGGMVFAAVAINAPADYAVAVLFGTMVLNGVTAHYFLRNRRQADRAAPG